MTENRWKSGAHSQHIDIQWNSNGRLLFFINKKSEHKTK